MNCMEVNSFRLGWVAQLDYTGGVAKRSVAAMYQPQLWRGSEVQIGVAWNCILGHPIGRSNSLRHGKLGSPFIRLLAQFGLGLLTQPTT
jgi:hypothetical protein